jgi:predicted RecA/RadA family phage recombinase
VKNFVQRGNTLTLNAPADILSGDAVIVGSIFGVANTDALSGEEVECDVVGVFDLPKATGALTQGAKAYWNTTNKNVTGTASGNTLIGVAVKAAGANDTVATVRLNGSF